MIEQSRLKKTGRFILEQKRVRLMLHKHPDGDVMGSCLGLARFLAAKGVDVGVFGNFEDRPAKFDFLPGFEDIVTGRDEIGNAEFADTLYMVVDSTGADRTGFAEGDFRRQLRIDHHIGGAEYDDLDLVDTSYAATTLLIADLLRVLDESAIDEGVATCLYTGLMTDTGGFRYSSTDAHAFRTAAFLVEAGADPAYCANLVNDRRNPQYLTLLANAINSVSYHEDGKVALLLLRPEDLPEAVRPEFGKDEFINLPRSLESVRVVVQMKKSLKDGDWKVGFRGKGEVNVQAVAADLGGGGHFSASGCELVGPQDETMERVLARVAQALREAGL
ncbi:bifunctional oligoribonuclease/PAP phosphatase NrnA [bacterium]|nr:bifunctional oligoribonuclease/PAP phosphatase NrnA [bacterium]